jgi:hypothetical protein
MQRTGLLRVPQSFSSLNQIGVQAESEGLYKYLTQFHTALGFVMTKYAPDSDPQATFDPRLPQPTPWLCSTVCR